MGMLSDFLTLIKGTQTDVDGVVTGKNGRITETKIGGTEDSGLVNNEMLNSALANICSLPSSDTTEYKTPFYLGTKPIYYRSSTISEVAANSNAYAQLRAADRNTPGNIIAFGGYYAPTETNIINLPREDSSAVGIRAAWTYASDVWRVRITVYNNASSLISNIKVWAFYTHGT